MGKALGASWKKDKEWVVGMGNWRCEDLSCGVEVFSFEPRLDLIS